jgi:hypothetical protein
MAANAGLTKDDQQHVNVNREENSRAYQYPTLSDSISDRETLGDLATPSHITLLVAIYEPVGDWGGEWGLSEFF